MNRPAGFRPLGGYVCTRFYPYITRLPRTEVRPILHACLTRYIGCPMRDSRTIFNTTRLDTELLLAQEKEKSEAGHLRLLSKKCNACGETFQQSRSWQSFCSTKCKTSYHRAQREQALTLAVERFVRAEAQIKLLQTELDQLKALHAIPGH